MWSALPNVARLWRSIAVKAWNACSPERPVFRARLRGRWLLGTVHPLPCFHLRNTNCASKLRRSPSRTNESFVTPLSCWLSRSLTGTFFWRIGYSVPNEFCTVSWQILIGTYLKFPSKKMNKLFDCFVILFVSSLHCYLNFRSRVQMPSIIISQMEVMEAFMWNGSVAGSVLICIICRSPAGLGDKAIGMCCSLWICTGMVWSSVREFRCAALAHRRLLLHAPLAPAPPAHLPQPALPCEKIIMQSPGRPVWNARQPLATRNQCTFKCVETHTPSITMDLSCRETDFSWGGRRSAMVREVTISSCSRRSKLPLNVDIQWRELYALYYYVYFVFPNSIAVVGLGFRRRK